MVRVRSLQEAYLMLKEDDPDTRVTVHLLRRLVADGTIPSIRAGRRIMLNYDTLIEYLSASYKADAQEEPEPSTIRPVSVLVK